MEWIFLVAIYISCMIIASGIRGGVRDEMDGIIDILAIALWPIWLSCFVCWFIYHILFNVGKSLSGRKI